jgi:surfactin synthase thioesterase subunit
MRELMQHESVPLLCLPFAGAGATFYRPWQETGVSGVDVQALQLPGREGRAAEPLHVDLHAAADELVADAMGASRGGPVTLFGHSLGAVLAYELAHRLADAGVEVVRLFASGAPDPFNQREHHATGLSDDDFLARVGEFAGHVDPLLEDPELRELVLPALRADVEMHETYVPSTDRALPVPISVIRAEDDHLVSHDAAAGWGKVAGAEFELVEVPGGHMYLLGNTEALLRLIINTVR